MRYENEGSPELWHYKGDVERLDVVGTEGFFAAASDILAAGDINDGLRGGWRPYFIRWTKRIDRAWDAGACLTAPRTGSSQDFVCVSIAASYSDFKSPVEASAN